MSHGLACSHVCNCKLRLKRIPRRIDLYFQPHNFNETDMPSSLSSARKRQVHTTTKLCPPKRPPFLIFLITRQKVTNFIVVGMLNPGAQMCKIFVSIF